MNHSWVQVRVEYFLPVPPFAAVWKETEHRTSHAKPEHVVSDGLVFRYHDLLTIQSGPSIEVLNAMGCQDPCQDTFHMICTYLSEYMDDRFSSRSLEAFSEFKTTKCVPKNAR